MTTSVDILGASAHRKLDRNDYKTLSLAALGGALEFYDFVVFVFFAAVLGSLFFPPEMPDWLRQLQTFGIFAAGYLARPLGGIIIAHFGDLLGRKRMFTLSIFLMAIPTLAMGLLPTYASVGIAAPLLLLLFRILQGAAIGGEVPGAWVFVSEHVPRRHTGLAVGTLTAGLTFGILLGSLIATAINSHYSQTEVHDFAWRIPFILGGVFGLFAVYLRRFLEETPVFKEMHARQLLAKELPLKAIVKNHLGSVVLSMLLTWVLSAAIVVVILFTPTYLQKQFAVTPALALQANSLAIVMLTIGCVAFGMAADRFGSKWTLGIGSLGLLISSYLFYGSLATASPTTLIVGYMVAGFFVGTVGAIPFVLVHAYPAVVRFSGLSFSYNVAYAIFGGLTPVMLTLWLKVDTLAPAHYVAALAVLGVVCALVPIPGYTAPSRDLPAPGAR
ncbi:MFS transporter [Chitiniphilus eburneus]|uniref:MHS family MFS transporter n=1 Tax=Chitiniphilus eburneus TaxID=2571148 RepID=A0A4U0PA40_9NEIS|nr:MFS transporter [Chitiniphilus eburneus]TJZ64481.1 MHS family MFS transporter [Chitiniphilus eburneus]